jgi:hypothetical protein
LAVAVRKRNMFSRSATKFCLNRSHPSHWFAKSLSLQQNCWCKSQTATRRLLISNLDYDILYAILNIRAI